VAQYASDKEIPLAVCRNVRTLPGLGIKGEVKMDGSWREVAVGRKDLMAQVGADLRTDTNINEEAVDNRSLLFAAWDGKVQGLIQVSDTLRKDAIPTAGSLRNDRIEVGILSGDSKAVVERIGKEVQVDFAFGELMPGEKVQKINDIRASGRKVVMVGDGINDAPALAAADVGIALGSATDLTKENADITIIGTQLAKIPWLMVLGKRTHRIIQWNLFWAFIYNIVGIALAAFGLLDPILAAFAMIISSVFIIFNSRRLNKI